MSVRDNIAFALKMAWTERRRHRPEGAQGRREPEPRPTTSSASRASSRAASASASPSAARSCASRRPSCSTSRSPTSTPRCACRCGSRSASCTQLLKTTMIYVTHDQVEAMTMADQIVVLDARPVEQVGSPLELYDKPNDLFVAGFIGSPEHELDQGRAGGQVRRRRPSASGPSIPTSRPPRGSGRPRCGLAEHLGSDTFLHVERRRPRAC